MCSLNSSMRWAMFSRSEAERVPLAAWTARVRTSMRESDTARRAYSVVVTQAFNSPMLRENCSNTTSWALELTARWAAVGSSEGRLTRLPVDSFSWARMRFSRLLCRSASTIWLAIRLVTLMVTISPPFPFGPTPQGWAFPGSSRSHAHA